MSPPMASSGDDPKIETPTTSSRGNPVRRSLHSSAPVMRLPSGHKTDHWAWDLSDAGLRMAQMQPKHSQSSKADEDDDLFLFPLGSGSFKTPSPFTTLPSSYFIAEQATPSDEKPSRIVTSEARQQEAKVKSVPVRPLVHRTRSYTPAPRSVKSTPRHRPVSRSQSITVASMKSARRRRHAGTHIREDESTLRQQVADLTQRVTMLLANQCAACRLGIIECGLQAPEALKVPEGESLDSDDDVDQGHVAVKEDGQLRGRGRKPAPEKGDRLEMLARQARMTAYG